MISFREQGLVAPVVEMMMKVKKSECDKLIVCFLLLLAHATHFVLGFILLSLFSSH